jgi:phage-related protein
MAFYGCEFIFDGLPCTEHGLMIYNFGSTAQGDVSFPSAGTVSEDRVANRYDAMMYGLTQNGSLEYTLVFGANTRSIDARESIDRFEADAIASWLTGHDTRKWLTIIQPDTDAFRYRCFISNLRLITYGELPWAFECTVNCDSPFAYWLPEEYTYTSTGQLAASLYNRSGFNGFYKPVIEITTKGASSFSVTNKTDNNRLFAFSSIPGGNPLVITVDNKNQIITDNLGLNLYPYFNMNFFRLKRGMNDLVFNGHGTFKITCEFPANIGA